MKLNKHQKKYIKNHYKDLSLEELSKNTELPERSIKDFLKESNLKTTEEKYKTAKETQTSIKTFSDLKAVFKDNFKYLLLLSLINVAVHFNSLFGKFVTADDTSFIKNPAVTNFITSLQSLYILYIQNSLTYNIFGPNPFFFHLNGLVLHLICTLLVFIVIYMLFGKRVGMLSALLFAVHPVNSEATSWIVAMSYIQAAILQLCVILFYLLYLNSKTKKYLFVSIAFYFAAFVFFRNPWVLCLAPILILMEYFLTNRESIKSVIAHTIPFLIPTVLFVIYLLGTLATERTQRLEEVGFSNSNSVPLNLRLPYSIFSMVRLFVFPKALSLFDEYNSVSQAMYAFMVLITILYFIAIFWFFKREKKLAGSLLIVLVSILPTLSPVQIAFFMSERYLYFGSIFFCAMLVYFFMMIERHFRIKNLALAVCITIAFIYSFRTFIRNADWHDSTSLWLATSRVSPNSPRVFNNLGDAYATDMKYDLSIEAFKKAVELAPEYSDAYHNLATTYLQTNQLDLAEQNFIKSYEFNPKMYQALYKLGLIESIRGNKDKAKEYLNKSLEINPNYEPAQKALDAL